MLRIVTGVLSVAIVVWASGTNALAQAGENAAATPTYRIYPLLDGHCVIRGDHAFYNGSRDESYDYALYLWLVLGGDKPILVDAGMSDFAEMNKGAARVMYEPVTKRPGENCRDQLRKFGLTPDDIGHVFITHLHFDHVDDLLLYRNAKVHVGRKEWELATKGGPTWGHGKILNAFSNDPDCKKRLALVGDEEVLPGFESFWVGGHTPGSTAYRVHTEYGWAVLTGDTVSLLANFERNVPPGVFTSTDECMAAMKKIREKADVVLPSHDPGTVDRWPPNPARTPRYTIRAIKVGECEVLDSITFQDGSPDRHSTFNLYVWVIEGGEHPIVVETGPRDPEGFSKGTAAYIPGGVKQLPEERTPEALKRHGIDPANVSHVIVTHLHADHYDYFDAFPNAKFVVNRQEYEQGKARLAANVKKALADRPDALQMVGDEEIVPGVRTFQLGCHTEGSQGVRVETYMGPAVLTGDVVYKYENIEQRRPERCPDPKACVAAIDRVRAMADIVLPAHDPLTLQRWPEGIIGAKPAGNERIDVSALRLVIGDQVSQPLKYAISELTEFGRRTGATGSLPARADTGRQAASGTNDTGGQAASGTNAFDVTTGRDWPTDAGLAVLVGRQQAEQFAPWMCRRIAWDDLGREGFAVRMGRRGESPVLIAAGATEAGTRQAIYEIMRQLDVSRLPPTLPAGLDKIETPSFNLRGMYAHQHWGYNYPYALRTWKVDEWKQYVDLLAIMRVNLFQIWSMAGILPVPFSPEDEAFLRRYPPVIDHAKQNHGMEVWIGECANNVCDRRDIPPVAQRDYFAVETLKNPADPAQMAQLRAAREAFYKVCDNADGYWVIDSDPGKWPGSPSREFVDILMMNRELITANTRLGAKAKLVYWMWFGWGNGSREEKWHDTLTDLISRSPEPWWMTVADAGHWKIVDTLGVQDCVVYYPYGNVEPEPSLPFTTVVPENLRSAMDVPERIGKIRGVMANAQTPVSQWPNISYFMRSAWNMDQRGDGTGPAMRELARWIYPEHAKLLAQAWLSLGDPAAPEAEKIADELQRLEKERRLGRPGVIGLKLFPDYGQVARDLTSMLRIHAAAMDVCRMAKDKQVDDRQVLDRLKQYCLLSLAWRKQTGFRNYGTNGCNFFPLRQAAHSRFWHDNRLDAPVARELSEAMKAQYEPWEVELIMMPLSQ